MLSTLRSGVASARPLSQVPTDSPGCALLVRQDSLLTRYIVVSTCRSESSRLSTSPRPCSTMAGKSMLLEYPPGRLEQVTDLLFAASELSRLSAQGSLRSVYRIHPKHASAKPDQVSCPSKRPRSLRTPRPSRRIASLRRAAADYRMCSER